MSCAFFNILMVYTAPAFTNLKNNVATTLAVALLANDTSISVTPGTGASFPIAPFYLSCEFEVMLCSSKTNDTLIVSRGQDGTTAAPHPINSVIEMRDTAVIIRDGYSGVNSAFAAVNDLQTQVGNGTALPANTVYTDKVQELTHKTIDLADSSKGNTIIGNVSPDPSQLVYQNLLMNGGFEEWYFPASATIPAGTPTSGYKSIPATNYWFIQCPNDTSITAARDTANTDPGIPSGIDCLLNVTTVQANDFAAFGQLYQMNESLSSAINPVPLSVADFFKLMGNPISTSARVKGISGNLQIRIRLSYWDTSSVGHDLVSAWIPVAAGYQTIKFENQVWIPPTASQFNGLVFAFDIKGVGQMALDNAMMIVGAVATNYRAKPTPPTVLPNLLTNGGFENWQRGNGPFQTNGTFTADRWRADVGSGSVGFDIHPIGSTVGRGLSAYVAANLSGTTPTFHFSQPISANDFSSKFTARSVTFSAKVKSNVVNTACIYIEPVAASIPGGFTFYRSRFNLLSAGVENLTVTAIIPGDATIFYVGLEIANASAVAEIDDCTLVSGQMPGMFDPLPPADDLARCMRYFEVVIEGGNGSYTFGGYNTAGAAIYTNIPLKVTKGGSSTITVNGTWNVVNSSAPTIPGYVSNRGFRTDQSIVATGYGYFQPGASPANFVTSEYNP
jgi:hypothetical protein